MDEKQKVCLCGAVEGRDRHSDLCPFPLYSNFVKQAPAWWAKYKDNQEAADRRRRAASGARIGNYAQQQLPTRRKA